jgi:hypothetical protein
MPYQVGDRVTFGDSLIGSVIALSLDDYGLPSSNYQVRFDDGTTRTLGESYLGPVKFNVGDRVLWASVNEGIVTSISVGTFYEETYQELSVQGNQRNIQTGTIYSPIYSISSNPNFVPSMHHENELILIGTKTCKCIECREALRYSSLRRVIKHGTHVLMNGSNLAVVNVDFETGLADLGPTAAATQVLIPSVPLHSLSPNVIDG